MKLIVAVVATTLSLQVFADEQAKRDAEIFQEIESKQQLLPKSKTALQSSFSNDSSESTHSRLIKVKLVEKGTAERIASETGLAIIGGSKKRFVSYKAPESMTMNEALAKLRGHEGVEKAQREVILNKHLPK